MVLTLFKIASGPAESGVSYKELSKINVHDLFFSVFVTVFRKAKDQRLQVMV